MGLHANARLSPLGRQLLCERIRHDGWTVEEAAFAANVSERTAYRWLVRYDAGESMTDRSSRPHTSPNRTPAKVEADRAAAPAAQDQLGDRGAAQDGGLARPPDIPAFIRAAVVVGVAERLPADLRSSYADAVYLALGEPEKLSYVRLNAEARA